MYMFVPLSWNAEEKKTCTMVEGCVTPNALRYRAVELTFVIRQVLFIGTEEKIKEE